MKPTFYFVLFLLLCSLSTHAQVVQNDSIANDSIVFNTQLPDLVIGNVKDSITPDEKAQLMALRRRVLKVYPYAKIAAERLNTFKYNMSCLKTEKEKKKYSKMVEKYLEDEFEGQLKKLSRKEGQILVKLIYRQTGESTYDIIKEQKSSWKAFWSNRMARLFQIDIKKTYSPANVAEDFMIEGFLLNAFEEHKLIRQEPAFTIDYPALKKQWRARQKEAKQKSE
ncbi:DUF4294 domain-containing protein [Flavobacterium sp. RHBU_3]|uniref:DUF4294 domain-containing protein n=1 Tax=Flavobacterium sp. RHBU_3 TaxID=3391184 RepID=UPI003984C787